MRLLPSELLAPSELLPPSDSDQFLVYTRTGGPWAPYVTSHIGNPTSVTAAESSVGTGALSAAGTVV